MYGFGFSGSAIFCRPFTSNLKLLLDTYTNSSFAYSLRKLSSTYSGDCIRVRRSSDNTEQNIGFVNNVLDTVSLLTFCGSGSGYVTTWYDQSGNGRNATRTNAVQQPLIVSSGSLNLVNSKPSIYFNSTYLDVPLSCVDNQTYFTVTKFNSVGTYISRVFGTGGNSHQLYQHVGGKYVMYNGGSGLFSTMNTDTNQKVIGTYWKSGSNSKLYFNGILNATGDSGSYTETSSTLGQGTFLEVQEHISWQSNYTSNMLAISTEQKNYYGF
jgi:hypothetical protein